MYVVLELQITGEASLPFLPTSTRSW